MERFIGLLLSGVMAGQSINLQDTGWVQEQYIINDYFHRVDDQSPIVYRSGRILGKSTTESNLLNRTDCSGILVGYMVELGIVKSRIMKGMDGLDSNTLIKLGKHKNRNDVVRGDWVYMEFPDGVRHIAVACDDRGENIYDLYLQNHAECRKQPPTSLTKYATNGIVEYLNQEKIILSGTVEVLNYFQKVKEAAIQNSGSVITGDITIMDKIITFISGII